MVTLNTSSRHGDFVLPGLMGQDSRCPLVDTLSIERGPHERVEMLPTCGVLKTNVKALRRMIGQLLHVQNDTTEYLTGKNE